MVIEYIKPYMPTEMNIEIMVVFAKELDPTLRNRRLRAALCPTHSRNLPQGNVPSLLMDGKVPQPLKRSTRVVDRAKVGEGLEGGD